eukprot:4401354-Prymnesium_polylepis.1
MVDTAGGSDSLTLRGDGSEAQDPNSLSQFEREQGQGPELGKPVKITFDGDKNTEAGQRPPSAGPGEVCKRKPSGDTSGSSS